jgi:predicted Abi (CAAX) family protease
MNPLRGGLVTWLVLIAVLLGACAAFVPTERKYLFIGCGVAVVAAIAVALLLRRP